MAPLRCAAKFDLFLSLDCAPTPSTLAQSKERKRSNFAIWQPCLKQEEADHEQQQDLERAGDRGHARHEAAGEGLRRVLDRLHRVVEMLAQVDGVGVRVAVHFGGEVVARATARGVRELDSSSATLRPWGSIQTIFA